MAANVILGRLILDGSVTVTHILLLAAVVGAPLRSGAAEVFGNDAAAKGRRSGGRHR